MKKHLTRQDEEVSNKICFKRSLKNVQFPSKKVQAEKTEAKESK